MSIERENAGALGRLEELSVVAFVARWTALVGEPPSIMLDDRRAMIAILVATLDAAPSPMLDLPVRGAPIRLAA